MCRKPGSNEAKKFQRMWICDRITRVPTTGNKPGGACEERGPKTLTGMGKGVKEDSR